MSETWWKDFFDAGYLWLWGGMATPEHTEKQVEGIWSVLGLEEGSKILDAPCGYGRIARPLADRGASVLGVDQSEFLIDRAQNDRGNIPEDRLEYRCHDLRESLAENGFDAAINIFSSLGYGTEEDDLAILTALRNALRPGGLIFVETNHRDVVVKNLSPMAKPGNRLEDGTLIVEELVFDPILGRVETTWFWSGPKGNGKKSASMRLYSATELTALLERAGFTFRSAHKGCSTELFDGEGRLALLAERP